MANLSPKTVKLRNESNLTLRSAHPDDANEVLATALQIMRTSEHLLTEPDEFNLTLEQEVAILRAHQDHVDKLFMIALVEGELVGMLNFSVGNRRRIAHQGALGVSLLPEFRGLGIGKLMMETLIEWAKANPRIEQLRLKVHKLNLVAHALYNRLGFIEEGREIRGIKHADGTYDDVICMMLPL